MDGRAPVPDQEAIALKPIFVGLCALVLATQAPAAAKIVPSSTPKVERAQQRSVATSVEQRIAQQKRAVRKHRSTIRFFANHRWLLRSEHRSEARAALRRAERGLARAQRSLVALRRLLVRHEVRLRARLSPRAVICEVFRRYCEQALAVAWCESRHSTTAQNGQYLGLFQMGYWERRTFGHGHTALQQARAAYRYFVRAGRDWSPWSCKPRFTY